MTLSQLAGAELSRQAIYLVETGKSKPSMPTLELIATRTGKAVSYFLSPARGGQPAMLDERVLELQRLCVQQQFQGAVELGEKILADSLPPSVAAQVNHYLGQALAKLNRADEALTHLHRAQALLEVEPDPWLAADCADWEACALYLKEDSRALTVAEKALHLCRETDPRLPGTEARILEHLATIHVKNHSYDRAIAYYEEALDTAGAIRDLTRMGRTYHGLGIAYQQLGNLQRATEFTHKALALFALERDQALIARGENELGLLMMRQGQAARAEELFRGAIAHFEAAGVEQSKSHVLLSLAELKMGAGHLDEAGQLLDKAIELATRLGETLALSTGHLLRGRLYTHLDRHGQSDLEFAAAFRLLSEAGLHDRLAESHADYAEVLEQRGDAAGASEHWREAAQIALRKSTQLPSRADIAQGSNTAV